MSGRVEDDLTKDDVIKWVTEFVQLYQHHPWASLLLESDGTGYFWITENVTDIDWSEE